MKILLLGDKGQVGREIVEEATKHDIEILGYDIGVLDITDRQAVSLIFADCGKDIDVVINSAAYTAVDRAEDEVELAYAVNRDGVENLALFCKEYNIPLIHISTDYVFSGDKKGSYLESDLTDPLGVYGKSKLAGEEVLSKVLPQHVIVRVSWVFGRYGKNFVKTILRLAQEKKELKIVGDQFGCPTPAKDIARILLLIAQKIYNGDNNWGIYHYCGKPVTTWFDFAKKILELARNRFHIKTKKLLKINTEEYPTLAKRPANSQLQVSRIAEAFGIEQRKWEEYLKTLIEDLV